jgi:hypothetical protein
MDLAEILEGLDDRQLVAVPTPEWPELDGRLFARKFCGLLRARYYAAMRQYGATSGADFVALVVACGTVDGDGRPVFEPEQYLWIRGKDADAQDRLAAEIDRLNVLSCKAQEELSKNSAAPGNSAA